MCRGVVLDALNIIIKTYKYLHFETKPTPLSVHGVKEHYMNGTQTSKYYMNAETFYITGRFSYVATL